MTVNYLFFLHVQNFIEILDRILVDTELKHWRLLMLQHLYSKLYMQFPEFDENGTPLNLSQLIEKHPNQKVILFYIINFVL